MKLSELDVKTFEVGARDAALDGLDELLKHVPQT